MIKIDDELEIIKEKLVYDKKHSYQLMKSKQKIFQKIGLAKIKEK